MDDALALLEEEFCPELDSALVQAVFSDFDDAVLSERVCKAREILEPIRAVAAVQQDAEFDASGCSGDFLSDENEKSSSQTGSRFAKSGLTEVTNSMSMSSLEDARSSHGSSSTDSRGHIATPSEHIQSMEKLGEASKVTILMETFPTLSVAMVEMTLKRNKDSFENTVDELLNYVYFKGNSASAGKEDHVPKGIDAFFEDHLVPNKRRNKKKDRKDQKRLSLSASTPEPTQPVNRWFSASEDIDFLASRTNLNAATVTSHYHKNGGSLPNTIKALINTIQPDQKESQDPIVAGNAVDLMEEFPAIDYDQALGLIRLAHPSTANAHELAKTFMRKPTAPGTPGGIQIITRFAPVEISSGPSTPRAHLSSPYTSPISANPASSDTLRAARNNAFNQASSYHRKGKSQPLMMAAAGYYSQVGHELHAASKSASSAEADAWVEAQSTSTQLDLHGVTVKDATRIAKEKVTAWWHGLGEGRINLNGRSGVGGGYCIITGVGNNSEGGIAKIGPAVGNMLVRDGWKVEFGRGVLVVTGVARKK